jgi:hypothetical protein
MSLSRAMIALAAAFALTLSACGGDDGGVATSHESESTQSGVSEATSEADDVCAALTPDDLGALLGGVVTVAEIPGGGCNFSQDDPRAPSAAVNQSAVDDFAGGFDALRTGVTGVIDGEVENLDDMGDDAFLVVGPAVGATVSAGAGGLLLGDAMVQVTVLQSVDLSDDDLRVITHDLLHLIADAA